MVDEAKQVTRSTVTRARAGSRPVVHPKNFEVIKMSENTTAASKAHAPEHAQSGDQPHAHKYPGRAVPSAEKVSDASHNHGALKAGRSNSMGVSSDGSHKGLPTSTEEVGRHVDQPGDDAHKYARNYPGRAYSKA